MDYPERSGRVHVGQRESVCALISYAATLRRVGLSHGAWVTLWAWDERPMFCSKNAEETLATSVTMPCIVSEFLEYS
jgi:hypothetical protein